MTRGVTFSLSFATAIIACVLTACVENADAQALTAETVNARTAGGERAGAQAAADTTDERPVYYGSEVVVTSDRPKRFESFATEADTLSGSLATEIKWTPYIVTGGYGASVYPAVRGLEAGHIGFEYEGVPMNNIQNGLADLALFEVFDLKATVMRGPFARLAGGRPAQAAISMSQSDGPGTGAAFSAGSRRDGARVSLERENTLLRLGLLSDEGYEDNTSAGGFGAEIKNLSSWGDAALSYVRMDRDVPGPASHPEFAGELRDELVIARTNLSPLGPAHPTFYVARQEEHYTDSLSEPTHRVTSGGAIVGLDVSDRVPGAALTASFDYSRVESADPLNRDLGEHSRAGGAAVASQVRAAGPLSLAIEVAGSHTSDFGTALSGAVGVAVATRQGHRDWSGRTWVSLGSSYRPPTINELYWPEDAWTGGNEDLRPERVLTVEVGVEGKAERALFARNVTLEGSLAGYASTADDLIAWAVAGTTGVWRPANVGRATLRGIEANVSVRTGRVRFAYAGSFSSTEDDASGLPLQYRPEITQWFMLGAGLERVRADIRARQVGSVYADDVFGRVTLSGYTIVDAALTYDLPLPGVALRLEASNLFDESYQTRLDYDMPGREWRAAVLIGWNDDGGTG